MHLHEDGGGVGGLLTEVAEQRGKGEVHLCGVALGLGMFDVGLHLERDLLLFQFRTLPLHHLIEQVGHVKGLAVGILRDVVYAQCVVNEQIDLRGAFAHGLEQLQPVVYALLIHERVGGGHDMLQLLAQMLRERGIEPRLSLRLLEDKRFLALLHLQPTAHEIEANDTGHSAEEEQQIECLSPP